MQVLATGGLSFPVLGTDGLGHSIAERLGHALHPCYPALTPLTGRHPAGQQLAGGSQAQVQSRSASNMLHMTCCRCLPVCCTAGRLPQGQEEGSCPSRAVSHAVHPQGLQRPSSPGPISPCHHGFGEPDTASPRSANLWQALHLASGMQCTTSPVTVCLQPSEPTGLGSPWSTGRASCSKGALHLHRQSCARPVCRSDWQKLCARKQAAMTHTCPN